MAIKSIILPAENQQVLNSNNDKEAVGVSPKQ
jgi:hypothetical protein